MVNFHTFCYPFKILSTLTLLSIKLFKLVLFKKIPQTSVFEKPVSFLQRKNPTFILRRSHNYMALLPD